MPKSVKIRCPHCDVMLRLSGDVFNQKVRCPECTKPIRIKRPEVEEIPEVAEFLESPNAPNEDFIDSLMGEGPMPGSGAVVDALPESPYHRQLRRKKERARRRAEEEAEDEDEPKRQRRESSGFSMPESPVLAFLIWVAAGSVAGVVGSSIWAAVGYYSGYELGFIAVFIGALVGIAIAMVADSDGISPGIVAALIAVCSVVGGKLAVAVLLTGYWSDALMTRDVNDPAVMTAYIAEEVLTEWEEQGKNLVWDEPDLDEAELEDFDEDEWYKPSASDYPAGVWAEAENRWNAKTPVEQDALKAALEADNEQRLAESAAARGFFTGLIFLFSFGPFDILWMILATVTAYRVALGIED